MLAPLVLAACGGDGPGGGGAARLLGADPGGVSDGGEAPPASFVLRGDDGELTIETGARSLAPDFPRSVPIPDGWRLDTNSRMTTDGITVWTTIWSTDDDPEQAAERFAAGLGADLPEILRYSADADGAVSVVGGWEGPELFVSAGFVREGPPSTPTTVSLTISDQPSVMNGGEGTAADPTSDDAGSVAGGLVGAIGGDEAADMLSSLGIGAKAEGLAYALNGRFEVVDDMTARLILGDGSLEDRTFDCIVVGALLDPGESVILVYPDGETTC